MAAVQDAVGNSNAAVEVTSTYTAPAAGTTVSGQEIWSAVLTAKGAGRKSSRGCVSQWQFLVMTNLL